MIEEKEFIELRDKVDAIHLILSQVFISASDLTKIKNLHQNTISQNDAIEKFNEIGKRKLIISLATVPLIKNRKKRVKSSGK